MRAWLETNFEWLATGIFIALVTSTIIGFKEGSKGAAILLSNASSATIALVFYPFLEKYDYAGPFVLLFGMVCGGCGTAVFGVVVSLGTVIERRKKRIAESLVDRAAPGSGDGK